jgi:hypothetical protein
LLSSSEPANSSTTTGPALRAGRPVGVLQTHAAQQRVRLCHPDLEVVEGDVEVDVRALPDQPVVGDHGDAGVLGRLQLPGQGGPVDGRDEQEVGPAGDHLVDLLGLGGDVVVRVLQVHLVAGGRELVADGIAVGDPPLGGLGRHGDPDRQVAGCLPGPRAATSPGALAAAGGQTQYQQGTDGDGAHPREHRRSPRRDGSGRDAPDRELNPEM